MKKLASIALAASMILGAIAAHAATEVKMTGDARIYGNFVSGRNFTGWNKRGTKTEDTFDIWERFRLRSDFVANEAVKFRLGIKVEDTWGHGTFTAANPTTAVQVDLAYLQFKVPNSDVEITAGLQDVFLPQSALFNNSVVWSDKMAALVINAPLIDNTLSVLAGFGRLIDSNQYYDTNPSGSAVGTTTQRADELDAYFLALPITVDGFKVTPWGTLAVAGKNALYNSYKNSTDNGTDSGTTFADTLTSAAAYSNFAGTGNLGRDNQSVYYWVGSAFEVTALDPIRFYADVIYGAGMMNDRKSSQRWGWFIDAGVEYKGLDVVTPQLFGYWSTGEDSSMSNGSERMPSLRSQWGPGNSFLFDSSQTLGKGNSSVYANPIGSWGLGISLNNMSFIEQLTHRLTFMYMRGTNSSAGLRKALVGDPTRATNSNQLGTIGNGYVAMGHDLTVNEYLIGLNFDTKYMIYENLAAVLETGWAHGGGFEKSVWGRRAVKRADDLGNNMWRVAFGLTYKF